VLLLGTELVVLALFAVIALSKAAGDGISRTVGDITYHSVHPSLSWMSPSGLSTSAIVAGLVLAVFIYWGWDTCVSVNEEAKDASTTPGRAAVLSTVILLVIYLVVSYGAVALLGPDFATDSGSEAIYALGKVALPTWLLKLLIIAILTSAAASCQTTILPATRTMLSMGSHGAAPSKLAQIDTKRLTPDFSSWLFGGVSIAWYLLLVIISHNTETNAYEASIAAVGMAIAVYYGLSGVSCILYFRRWIFTSVKNFVLIGVLPAFGGAVLIYVFVRTVWDSRNADYGYGTLFGVGTVLVIGTLLLVLGVPLMLWCSKKYPHFFTFRPDPSHLVKDPNSDDTLAAPLGTYRKGA
jgi:amino acid transporter